MKKYYSLFLALAFFSLTPSVLAVSCGPAGEGTCQAAICGISSAARVDPVCGAQTCCVPFAAYGGAGTNNVPINCRADSNPSSSEQGFCQSSCGAGFGPTPSVSCGSLSCCLRSVPPATGPNVTAGPVSCGAGDAGTCRATCLLGEAVSTPFSGSGSICANANSLSPNCCVPDGTSVVTTGPGAPATGGTPPTSGAATGQGKFVPLSPIPGLTDIQPTTGGLATFLNNLYKYLIGLAAVLAVLEIIYGGLQYSTQDSVSKHEDGKERIQNALLGLVLVLSPYLVFSIINPAILNLSLSLQPLKTPGGANIAAQGTGSGTTVDPVTNCSVRGNASILQFADCPSEQAARDWGKSCSNLTEIVPSTTAPVWTIGCVHKTDYEFIDVHTSFAWTSTGVLNGEQPVAVTTGSQTNGVDAVQFASICNSAGFETCLNDTRANLDSHDCSPQPKKPLPAAAPHPPACYTETLSCQHSTWYGNKDCASPPNWAPYP